MLNTYNYFGDELDLPIKVIRLNELDTHYDFGESHRHNYFEIFFFIKGGGMHTIDFKERKIVDYSAHIVSARKVHLLKRAIDSNGYIILFKRELLSNKPERSTRDFIFLLQTVQVDLSESEFNRVEFLIIDLMEVLSSNSAEKEDLAQTMLHLIILKLINNADSDQLTKKSIYLNFVELLEENYMEESSSGFYADKLNVSSDSLTREIKKLSGKTSSDHIQERRLLEAKRLLTHSELTLKEISNYLNFNDSAHFTHSFKSKTGFTPTLYRENSEIYKTK